MNTKIFDLMKKIEGKEKISYDEFIELVNGGLEMQFYYKKRKFGVSRFDGFEFYEWEKDEGYQKYNTITDFAQNIKIDGICVKDIWDEIKKVNFAD